MRNTVAKLAPKPLFNFAKTILVHTSVTSAFRYDRKRYIKYSSSMGPFNHRDNLAAMITERYHSIEKGLSLPNPRPGFGSKALEKLLSFIDVYREQYEDDQLVVTVAGVLRAYMIFNSEHGFSESDIPHGKRIAAFVKSVEAFHPAAGVRDESKQSILEAVSSVGIEFFEKRYSVRQFADTPVDVNDIKFATRAALKSPAVCNRQFARVHAFLSPSDIRDILEIQGGARGFESDIKGLAILTTNLRSYWNDTQRNQAWIDGGLFAMNFLLGLHARGLGAVSLNWSKTPQQDQELRGRASIPQEEAIIMLVAFGNLRDKFQVASSVRRSFDDALRIS